MLLATAQVSSQLISLVTDHSDATSLILERPMMVKFSETKKNTKTEFLQLILSGSQCVNGELLNRSIINKTLIYQEQVQLKQTVLSMLCDVLHQTDVLATEFCLLLAHYIFHSIILVL